MTGTLCTTEAAGSARFGQQRVLIFRSKSGKTDRAVLLDRRPMGHCPKRRKDTPSWTFGTVWAFAVLAFTAVSACGGDDVSERTRLDDDAETATERACIQPLPEGQYDYIVVGSGAGGGPVASRLARAGCSVLLLEAGEDVGESLAYRVPAMHALSTETNPMAWWFFVDHHVDDAVDSTDSKITDAGILYPRGSALGGSTAVNALVTVLPSPSDWNRLAQLTGDANFRASVMTPYYDRVREWLSIELPDPSLAMGDSKVVSFLVAAANAYAQDVALGTSIDPNDAARTAAELGRLLQQDLNASLRSTETTGLFRLPLATKDGERNGTREFIVDTVDAGHPLTVRTGAFVTRILFDDDRDAPRARGVEFAVGPNTYGASLAPGAVQSTQQAIAAREVIVAAGAFNSPQLLMLSGIGDAAHLQELGIEPLVDRPGVGRNLQDRYEVAVVTEFDAPLDVIDSCELTGPWADDPCAPPWRDGQGVYTTSGFLASVLRRSDDDVALADLQVFATPSDARGYYPGYSVDALADSRRFSWLILKAHTSNRDGFVRLDSADPFARPRIDFNYFDESDPLTDPDLEAVVEGVKFVREIETRVRDRLVDDHLTEVWPGDDVATDEAIAEWVRKETWGHHASCSNKMGKASDPLAVVDPRFRVIGTQSLRVVDASVFPEIPGTFIAMPTFMLAERAADVILEDAR